MFASAVMLSESALTAPRADTIFYCGFAIHGTNDIAQLSGPASHGCVRHTTQSCFSENAFRKSIASVGFF
jgi:hypothetical protein